jgi:hypothetical protein
MDSKKNKKTAHLIHGLTPLIEFLHTDKVTLTATKPCGWKSSWIKPKVRSTPSDMESDKTISIKKLLVTSPLLEKYPLLAERARAVCVDKCAHLEATQDEQEEQEQPPGEGISKGPGVIPHYELSDDEVIDAGLGASSPPTPLLLRCKLLQN